MNNLLFLLKLVRIISIAKKKNVKDSKFQNRMEFSILFLILAFTISYFIISINNRPTIVEELSSSDTISRGENEEGNILYNHRCECKNVQINFSDCFLKHTWWDCLEDYPTNGSDYTNLPSMSLCDACQFAVDRVTTYRKFQSVNYLTEEDVKSILVEETHSILIMQGVLMTFTMNQIAYFNRIADLKYEYFLANDSVLDKTRFDAFVGWMNNTRDDEDFFVDKIVNTYTIDYEQYTKSCNPHNCQWKKKQPLTSIFITTLSFVGGTSSFLIAIGVFLVKKREKKIEKKKDLFSNNDSIKNSQSIESINHEEINPQDIEIHEINDIN